MYDGVYHYGSYIGFPTGSWNASNHYVDVAFTPTTPPQQVISNIGLSNKTVAANQPAGTVVGQASVVMSPTTPAFSGSLATPATDAYFQISGTALTTKHRWGREPTIQPSSPPRAASATRRSRKARRSRCPRYRRSA